MARHVPDVARSPLNFWTKLATRSQSNLYFALVFLDRERRNAFRDVYRFVRAADDVADSGGPPPEVLNRLRDWRSELDAIYAGDAAHPWGQQLARAVQKYGLDRSHFDSLLGALESDVGRTHIASFDQLREYCEQVASSLAMLCLQILGVPLTASAQRYARDVGVALQLANILRDVREDAAQGRIYLPQDELTAAGVTDQDVFAGRSSPGLRAVCRRQAERARALISGAREQLSPELAGPLLVPEIWADVYLALLDCLEEVDFDVFRSAPYLRRRRKLALALRRWAGSSERLSAMAGRR